MDWLLDHDVGRPGELADALRDRRRRADAIVAEIGNDGSPRFEREEVAKRWAEITAHLDAGVAVTLTRDGTPWCTIAPTGLSVQDQT